MAGDGGVDAKLVVLVSTVVRPISRILASADPRTGGPRITNEMGPSEDTFKVYMEGVDYPPDAPPVRRYMAKDALNAPHVWHAAPDLKSKRRAWLKLQQAFTHTLDMYDKKIDEMYRLGYSFPNTIQPDRIQLALDRREEVLAERAAERREKEAERRAEMEAEQEKEKARREYEAAKNRTIRERL